MAEAFREIALNFCQEFGNGATGGVSITPKALCAGDRELTFHVEGPEPDYDEFQHWQLGVCEDCEALKRMFLKEPSTGDGLHKYLFRVAAATAFNWTEEEVCAWLHGYAAWAGREDEREIAAAIRDGRAKAFGAVDGNGQAAPARWPAASPELIEAICREGAGFETLRGMSPVSCEDNEPSTEGIIDRLFPNNPWICAGKESWKFSTRRREEWRGQLSEQSFVVPSAMLGRYGFTSEGKVSEHAQSSVGTRQFLVVECDFAEKSRDGKRDTELASLIRKLAADKISVADMCAAVLVHLRRFAPLVLVVSSGGRSLHGWFPCAGMPEEDLRKFMSYAVELGADPKTWSASQFVRMPDGTRREHGQQPRRQSIIYFAPEVLPYA